MKQTSKELVRRAIERRGPERTPVLYFNKLLERSDILRVGYEPASDFHSDDPNRSEWGFLWERLDDTMGQPIEPPLEEWDMFERWSAPDPNAPGRFEHVAGFVEQHPDKYIIGEFGISGLNFITFLRGFENTMADFYLEPEKLDQLIDIVYNFEKEVIRNFCERGVDAIGFGDDLGTQTSLMISPQLWREKFLLRYKENFDLVHSYGKHVYFHSCGYVYDIIPDLIEAGVDVFNFNQPDLLGIDRLNKEFGGKVSFCCPVDHQTVAIHGTREEIFAYVRHMQDTFGSHNGGYIGYVEEYSSVGMSAENFKAICDAFDEISGTKRE